MAANDTRTLPMKTLLASALLAAAAGPAMAQVAAPVPPHDHHHVIDLVQHTFHASRLTLDPRCPGTA